MNGKNSLKGADRQKARVAGLGASTLKCQKLIYQKEKKIHFKTACISQSPGLCDFWLWHRPTSGARRAAQDPGPSLSVRVAALESRA